MPLLATAMLAAMALVGNTIQVGPARTNKTPQDGYNAAVDGDTIEIDAGDYPNTTFKVSKSNLTFKGVGGRPHLSFSGNLPNGKGVIVIEDPTVHDITFENLEISGGHGTSGNEAAIRYQGKNLTVRGCYLHDNYNGILEGHMDVSGSVVLVENTELAYNGRSGYEHNMYISESVEQLTVRYSYSHHVLEGHLLKTRAKTNYIYANRLTDEDWSGNGNQASAVIDIPQGGASYVIGNMLHKGTHPGNPLGAIWYARENNRNSPMDLFVVNNTFVSDTGVSTTAMVLVQRGTNIFVANNIMVGPSDELVHFEDTVTRTVTITHNLLDSRIKTATTWPGATVTNPPAVSDFGLVNVAGFDWHLTSTSPAKDAGADPGTGDSYDLTPVAQYVHPVSAETRTAVDVIDIGAFEYGNVGTPIAGGGALPSGGGGTETPPGDGSGSGGTGGSTTGGSTPPGSAPGDSTPSSPTGANTSGGNNQTDTATGLATDVSQQGCAAAPPSLWALTVVFGLLRRRRRSVDVA